MGGYRKGYRKILVAIDGSDSSMHALQESLSLAFKEGSQITVVSVAPRFEGDLSLMEVGNISAALKNPFEIALSKAKEMAKSSRLSITIISEEGEPYERILDVAEAENCDLIVMGTKGMSGIERVLVGSVAAAVIGHSHRDVLVIPAKSQISWQRILVTTDGSKYSEAAAERAINYAKAYGSELAAVAVVDAPAELSGVSPGAVEDMIRKAKRYVEEVKSQADSAGLKTETFVLEGEEAYRKITEFAKEHNINIIVMGSHGRRGLSKLLVGSVAERIIGYAHCPVLIAKA
jgi:nucleotide-binding universal stress UspA family protein